jgi:hypothetical protein
MRAHRGDEDLGAMRVVAEHVEAGAGRRQQHGVAGLGEGGAPAHGARPCRPRCNRHAAAVDAIGDACGIAPDQRHGACVRREDRAQRGEVLPLAVAAENQHHLAPQPFERGHRRADVGALGVVVERTPPISATFSTRCGKPRKLAQRGDASARRRQADRFAQRQCGQGVGGVVQAGQLDLASAAARFAIA